MRLIRLIGGSLAVAAFCGPLVVAPAGAGKANAIVQTAFQPIVNELVQTRNLLQAADHDYKGHRSAAVKEITKAIHALDANGGQHKKTGVHPHTGKPHEVQALSDAQLRAAIQALVTVGQQLQSAGAKYPRAGKAALDVQLAVKQLNMALAIK